ncbi:MAG: oligosaccharide flippase family protein [Syntrophales bacterium]|nr:oligosaccharide flippase family protein [Syntrophales bacterium]
MIRKVFNSSLARNAGIYTLANIINSAIPFFLMPVLTRYMSTTDYGIVAMFSVLLAFVSPFTGLSIHGAIQRQYYEKEKIDLPVYITNCLLILVSSSALVFIVFSFFATPISKISSFPESWLWVVVIVSIAQFITLVNLSLWQVQLKARAYGFYQIAQTMLNVGLSLLLVVCLGMTWQGRIQAQLFTMIVFGCIGLLFLYKGGWIKFVFNIQYINNALRFGVPLLPHALGGTMMVMTDRFFITNMVGLDVTGLYSVGYQVGMIIGLLGTSFNQAYVPWLFQRLKQNKEKSIIVKVTYIYFLLLIFLVICLTCITPWFLSFFVGKNFSGAGIFVFWIALGFAFNGMYYMIVNFIFFVEKTYILAWITLSCALLNIPFNYVFIKWNGPVGAAQSSALTFFIFFVVTWILSSHVYKMPWLLSWSKRAY